MSERKIYTPIDASKIPNPLLSDFVKDGDLWVPSRIEEEILFPYFSSMVRSTFAALSMSMWDEPKPAPPDKSEFEVNMMEALVGWRKWKIFPNKQCLDSINLKGEWFPDTVLEAKCREEKHAVPAEFCTCGIYAKDTLDDSDLEDYEGILGQVSGWGRYVRGNSGWRAQFAYPKSFYVNRSVAPDTIERLKTFHVPIFVDQPQLIYNPEEDGYEYRDDETYRNLGAYCDPDAEEEDDYGDDEEN